MIRAAIVGIGWWGRTLVNAVQGKSGVIRFTAGVMLPRILRLLNQGKQRVAIAVKCAKMPLN